MPRPRLPASNWPLNTRLTDAEVILLADALEHHRDVVITYRDKNGGRTRQEIEADS